MFCWLVEAEDQPYRWGLPVASSQYLRCDMTALELSPYPWGGFPGHYIPCSYTHLCFPLLFGFHMPRSPEPSFSVHSARLLFPQYCCWEKAPSLKEWLSGSSADQFPGNQHLKGQSKKCWTAHCSPSDSFLSMDSSAPVYSNCCNPSKSVLCH